MTHVIRYEAFMRFLTFYYQGRSSGSVPVGILPDCRILQRKILNYQGRSSGSVPVGILPNSWVLQDETLYYQDHSIGSAPVGTLP